MRITTLSFLLFVLFLQSCNLFQRAGSSSKNTSSAPDAKHKGIDQMAIKPVEYSTNDRNLDYVTKFNRAAVLEMAIWRSKPTTTLV